MQASRGLWFRWLACIQCGVVWYLYISIRLATLVPLVFYASSLLAHFRHLQWLPQSFSAVTFTIFSLFRVPVRFVLCPGQHPRHKVMLRLSYTATPYTLPFPASCLITYKPSACQRWKLLNKQVDIEKRWKCEKDWQQKLSARCRKIVRCVCASRKFCPTLLLASFLLSLYIVRRRRRKLSSCFCVGTFERNDVLSAPTFRAQALCFRVCCRVLTVYASFCQY